MWLFALFFLNSASLICRGMDISKYFRDSLGIRDIESRLNLFRPSALIFRVNIIVSKHLVEWLNGPESQRFCPLGKVMALNVCLAVLNGTPYTW